MYIKEVSQYPSTEEYFSLLKTIESRNNINVFDSINLPQMKAKPFFSQLITNGNIDNLYISKLEEEFGLSFTGLQLSKNTKLDISKLEKFLIEREKYNKISKDTIHDLLLYNLSMYFSTLSTDGSNEEIRNIKTFIKNELLKDEESSTPPVELLFLNKKIRKLKLEYINKSSILDILDDIEELSEDKSLKGHIDSLKKILDIEN